MSKGRRLRSDRAGGVDRRSVVPVEFRALATHLTGLADALDAVNGGPHGPAAPAYLDAADEAFGPMFYSRPGLEASVLPHQTISHACDHIRGIGALVAAPGVVLSALTLLRPAVESAATAHYLLEPGVGTRERVRRWANTQLRTLVEQERLLLGAGDRQHRTKIAQDIATLLEQAKTRGYEVTARRTNRQPDWPKEQFLGAPLPSAQALITGLFGGIAGEIGPFYHRFLSAVVHGQQHGLMPFLATASGRPGSSSAVSLADVRITFADLVTWTGPLLSGAGALEERARRYYDWPRTPWDRRYRAAVHDYTAWMSGPH